MLLGSIPWTAKKMLAQSTYFPRLGKELVQKWPSAINTVEYLLKARIVEPVKRPLLCKGYVTRNSGVTVENCVFCAARAQAI
jgi:hypothetical protein